MNTAFAFSFRYTRCRCSRTFGRTTRSVTRLTGRCSFFGCGTTISSWFRRTSSRNTSRRAFGGGRHCGTSRCVGRRSCRRHRRFNFFRCCNSRCFGFSFSNFCFNGAARRSGLSYRRCRFRTRPFRLTIWSRTLCYNNFLVRVPCRCCHAFSQFRFYYMRKPTSS